MTHLASALVRFGSGADATWSGVDLDLTDHDDVDALVDVLDEVVESSAVMAGEDSSSVAAVLVLVEEDDEWMGVVRIDDGDVRCFVSDRRVVQTSELAERFFADALVIETDDDKALEELEERGTPDVSNDPSAPTIGDSERPEIEPGGDAGLLSDLGVSADRVLKVAKAEGMLPADALAALAEGVGAGAALEELRGE